MKGQKDSGTGNLSKILLQGLGIDCILDEDRQIKERNKEGISYKNYGDIYCDRELGESICISAHTCI